jgi:hypothetical protein
MSTQDAFCFLNLLLDCKPRRRFPPPLWRAPGQRQPDASFVQHMVARGLAGSGGDRADMVAGGLTGSGGQPRGEGKRVTIWILEDSRPKALTVTPPRLCWMAVRTRAPSPSWWTTSSALFLGACYLITWPGHGYAILHCFLLQSMYAQAKCSHAKLQADACFLSYKLYKWMNSYSRAL